MRVLLTGTESCGIDRVGRDLQADGHVVLSCWEPSALGGCRAGTGRGDCPSNAGIDVIVAARQHPLPHLTARERLVGCAQLTGVPLIVVGSTALNPYGSRVEAFVEGFDEVASAVRRKDRVDQPAP